MQGITHAVESNNGPKLLCYIVIYSQLDINSIMFINWHYIDIGIA